jgi:lipopolysaccharide export system permease protein
MEERPNFRGEVGVFGSILQRMILWELTKVFLVALVGITGILLMAGIISEASQQGLGPSKVLAAIPLLIPSTLPYTIPATTLFATCVVYGRLAADNEILAIKSAGISILKVVTPGLVLGLAMSAATLGLYDSVIPRSHRLLRALIFHDAKELIYTVLKKHGTVSHAQLPYSMFVEDVRGERLLAPVIKRKDKEGHVEMVASGQDADLNVDADAGALVIRMRNCTASFADGSWAFFEERTWELPLPGDLGDEAQRRPRDLTRREIARHREETEDDLEGVTRRLWGTAVHLMWPSTREDVAEHLQNLKDRLGTHRKQLVALEVEALMRPALSVGCLCFILVGCPVGIRLNRSDYLSSFIICFLPIVIIYYPLLLCGTGLAKEGRLPPVPLVWAANAVVGLIGLGLFARLLRN